MTLKCIKDQKTCLPRTPYNESKRLLQHVSECSALKTKLVQTWHQQNYATFRRTNAWILAKFYYNDISLPQPATQSSASSQAVVDATAQNAGLVA